MRQNPTKPKFPSIAQYQPLSGKKTKHESVIKDCSPDYLQSGSLIVCLWVVFFGGGGSLQSHLWYLCEILIKKIHTQTNFNESKLKIQNPS